MFRCLSIWLGLQCIASARPTQLSPFTKRTDAHSVPRIMSYVQTFHTLSGDPLSLLPLRDQHTGITHVYLASLHVNIDPGDITLNNDNPNSTVWDTMWDEAAQLQESGIKVLMLLGGAAVGSYRYLCSGSLNDVIDEDYYIPLLQTIKYHKLDGLDLDIEEKLTQNCPVVLLQRLYADLGPSFLITMSPVASSLQPGDRGLGGLNYTALDAAATAPEKPSGKIVDWFNAQFYNGWGDASSVVGYNSIIAHGYAPERVVMGVLDSPGDGGSGWYALPKYEHTLTQLRASYPQGFGGVIGWEYWDAGANDSLPHPWEWERDVGITELGPASPPGYGPDMTSAPIPYGAAPWPGLMAALVGLGVDWLDGVVALNESRGSLVGAKEILGLPMS